MTNKIILKEKRKRYTKRLQTVLQQFLARSFTSDRSYIERYIDCIHIMGIVDPGRLPYATKDTTGTKRGAFLALLSRLISAWWVYNEKPETEAEFVVLLKQVDKITNYSQMVIKGNVKDGFTLEII
jgi:hypothetical protein